MALKHTNCRDARQCFCHCKNCEKIENGARWVAHCQKHDKRCHVSCIKH